tara:strand:+ start:2548 stop:2775 length:228 start_codon:yes stop_codon:yes gene_type:complete
MENSKGDTLMVCKSCNGKGRHWKVSVLCKKPKKPGEFYIRNIKKVDMPVIVPENWGGIERKSCDSCSDAGVTIHI